MLKHSGELKQGVFITARSEGTRRNNSSHAKERAMPVATEKGNKQEWWPSKWNTDTVHPWSSREEALIFLFSHPPLSCWYPHWPNPRSQWARKPVVGFIENQSPGGRESRERGMDGGPCLRMKTPCQGGGLGVGELFLNALNRDEPAHYAADRTSEICLLFPQRTISDGYAQLSPGAPTHSPSVTLAATPSSSYLLAV